MFNWSTTRRNAVENHTINGHKLQNMMKRVELEPLGRVRWRGRGHFKDAETQKLIISGTGISDLDSVWRQRVRRCHLNF